MPKKGENFVKFKNYHRQLKVPFVIYADFEAIREKVSSCKPNDNHSYTEAYQKQRQEAKTAHMLIYKVVCCYDDKYVHKTGTILQR